MAFKIFKPGKELTVQQQITRRTVLSFMVLSLFAVLGYFTWTWLYHQPELPGPRGGVQKPLRQVLEANEKIFNKAFSGNHLAKTFPVEMAAKKVRVNGNIGLTNDNDTANWQLHVVRNPGDTLLVSLSEIKKLPKTEVVFDFKCVEGWSQVTRWAGVRYRDFAAFCHLDTTLNYVGFTTPDGEYYVGIDMPSAMHPQTLLCYEMNGQPLPMNQGYPLRMIIPVKYGIKSLKRIGTIYLSSEKPKDYWAERGYDYYAGL
ncbi:MAG: molybdopterin-dependent oxidoreductase [Bacteroidota bacterium]|nr:molybdopterin-dependent oxidoreductase [Bacteroidota bacterium]